MRNVRMSFAPGLAGYFLPFCILEFFGSVNSAMTVLPCVVLPGEIPRPLSNQYEARKRDELLREHARNEIAGAGKRLRRDLLAPMSDALHRERDHRHDER